MYYDVNVDALNEQEENMAPRAKVDFFSVKDGKNKIRILPPWSEEGLFVLAVKKHYLQLGGTSMWALCLDWLLGNKFGKRTLKFAAAAGSIGKSDKALYDEFGCPACYLMHQLYQQGKGAYIPYHVKPQRRYYMNVYDYGDGQVKLYAAPRTVYEQIKAQVDVDPECLDPKNGSDCILTVVNAGTLNVKYSLVWMKKPTAIPDGAEPIDIDKYLSGNAVGFTPLVNAVFDAKHYDDFSLQERLGPMQKFVYKKEEDKEEEKDVTDDIDMTDDEVPF